jgi:hypothetical protein
MANGDNLAELRAIVERFRRENPPSANPYLNVSNKPTQPSSFSNIYDDQSPGFYSPEDKKEDIPLLEQLIEGVKEIPSGLYSTLLDAPAGLLTALTPTVDLPIEQRLREAAARGLRERDPRMEGRFIPTLGSALGSIGAYTGAASLSAYLAPAAVIAGGPLAGAAYGALALAVLGGISEQGRRIAQREQKTGRDIPAWKETPAHLAGAAIGLTELIPLKLGRTGIAGKTIPEDVWNYLRKRGVIRKAIGQGTEEAFQESAALALQSTVGRGLYDPDAFDDLGKAMVEDFKVGGAAGVISSLVGSAYVGGRRRWDRGQRLRDYGTNMTLTKALEKEAYETLDMTTLDREVRKDLQAENVSENTIVEVLGLLNWQTPLASPIQDLLYNGSFVDRQMLSHQRRLLRNYYSRVGKIIDNSGNPEVIKSKPVIQKYIEIRMNKLDSLVNEMEREGINHGGLTRSKQYEEVKRGAFDDSTGENVLDHASARDDAKGRGRKAPTFRDKIRQVIGGEYGILSLFRSAEILGVHDGLGSSQIKNKKESGTSMLGPDITVDETLASSENASYSPIEIARVLADNYGSFVTGASLGPESVKFLKDIEVIESELERAEQQAIKAYPLFSTGDVEIDSDARRRNADLLMEATAVSTEKARALLRDQGRASVDFIARHLDHVLRNVKTDQAFRQKVASELGMRERDLVDWLDGFTGRMRKNQQELIQTENAFDKGLSDLRLSIESKYDSEIQQLKKDGDEQGVREATANMNNEIAEVETQFRQNRQRIKSDISATDLDRMASLFLGTDTQAPAPTPTKTKPGVLPMNFRDGDRGLSMQPQFKGASTFDLIKSGNRTGTSRFGQPTKYAEENYKVGDVIEVKGKGKEKILVEIQAHDDGSVWKKVSDIPAQEWMASEGWDLDAYNKLARAGNFQVRYKYLSPAQVTTPTKATPKKSVIDALFGMRALNDIFNWNSYRIIAPSTVDYAGEAGKQVNILLDRIETQRKKDPSKVVDISEQDIINLLSSKNYFLSGGGPLKLSDQMVKDLYGDQVGLDSLPFRKLLADMTGAKRWVDATPSQKLLMYSRLLQLPGRSKGDNAYLPDFYDDPIMDITTDAVLQAIVRPIRGQALGSIVTEEQIETIIEREIGRANVDTQRIKISLARLVESRLVQITNKGYRYNPDVDKRAFGDLLEKAKERWGEEVDPNEMQKVLNDPAHDEDIRQIQLAYNAATKQRLDKKTIIKRLGNYIGSEAGLEEAARLGLMADFRGSGTLGQPLGGLFPNNQVATNILTTMIREGAIPASISPTAGQLQKAFLSSARNSFSNMKTGVNELVKNLGIGEHFRTSFIDELNGLFDGVAGVSIRGKKTASDGLGLMKEGLITRLVLDLSALDPNNVHSEQDLANLLAVVLKGGTIDMLMRDYFTDGQLKTLINFVRTSVVPEEVNPQAFNNNVTWEEAHALGMSNTEGLNPLDIAHGAIGDVFVAIQRGEIRKKNIPKPVNAIHGITRNLLGGLIRSAQKSDLQQVISIYNGMMGGTLASHARMQRQELKDKNLITDEGVPLNLIRYADPAEVAELRTAQSLVDKLVDPTAIREQQKKVDEITKRIVSRRRQIQQSAPAEADDEEKLNDDVVATRMARDEQSYGIPIIGQRQTLDERTYENARHLAMGIINDGKKPYTMPTQYRAFFEDQSRVSKDVKDKIASRYKKGDPLKQLIMPGGPLAEKLAGNSFEETVKKFSDAPEDQINYSKLRLNHIDRREASVGLEEAIAAKKNKTMIDVMQSALNAWRVADISGNKLQALMLHGPLTYTGFDSFEGMFEWTPVEASPELKEKYNIDHIPGMLEIVGLIDNGTDETAALLYGLAKVLAWDKAKDTEYRGTGILSPEADRLEKMHKKRYEGDRKAIIKNAKRLSDGKIKSEADLETYIGQIENNKTNENIVKFWDLYEAFNKHMLRNVAYPSNLITEERLQALLDRPYVPRYHQVEETDDGLPTDSTRVRGPNILERQLSQSDMPIGEDLVANIQRNMTAMIRDSMYEVAMSRTVRDLLDLGQAYEVKMSRLLASVTHDVVEVKDRGVSRFFKLNDKALALATMQAGINPEREWQKFLGGVPKRIQEPLLKGLLGAPNIVRQVVTRSLDFMAKNVFRDATIARMIAGPKVVGMGFYLDVLEKALGGARTIAEAEKLGISFGVEFFNTPYGAGDEAQQKRADKELKQAKLSWKKWYKGFGAMGVTWQALGKISQATETATRVALYEAVLAETGDKGLAFRSSIELLNYGRRGMNPVSAMVMSTMPFIHGRIAGMDVGHRALFSTRDMDRPGFKQYGYTAKEWEALPWYEKEKIGMWGTGLFLGLATGIYYAMMQDNEEWKALNELTAANNWMIPIGGGFLKVPIPHEFGYIFKLIPEQIMKAMLEKEYTASEARSMIFSEGIKMFTAGGPTLIAPFLNVQRNHDTFLKQPIVSRFMEDLPPEQQQRESTSPIARGMSAAVRSIPFIDSIAGARNFQSPMLMEYFMNQYLTGIAMDTRLVLDKIIRESLGMPTIGTREDYDLERIFGVPLREFAETGELIIPAEFGRLPFLGDLFEDPRLYRGYIQEMYELIDDYDKAKRQIDAAKTYEDIMEIRTDNKELIERGETLLSMRRRLSALRQREDRVQELQAEGYYDSPEGQKRLRKEELLQLEETERIAKMVPELSAYIKTGER